ncbi:MAG: hypothetical protein ACTH4U_08715 [Pseudoalteromonas prydzensis]|uniref:hypothetical protein n=1 Tax=Pseudoalteromonas prydzensis TaxID=182141 RepID=UPI003F9AF9AA
MNGLVNNWTIIASFVSWLIVIIVHIRTLKKTESNRLKDKAAKELEKVYKWLKEIDKDYEFEYFEDELATKVTIAELSCMMLNKYMNISIIDMRELSKIRDFEANTYEELKLEIPRIIEIIHTQTVELESKYFELINKAPLKRFYSSYNYDLKCLAMTGLILFLYKAIFFGLT